MKVKELPHISEIPPKEASLYAKNLLSCIHVYSNFSIMNVTFIWGSWFSLN